MKKNPKTRGYERIKIIATLLANSTAMRKIVLLLLLLLASAPSFAQNFNKLFTIEGVATIPTGTVILNNRVFITGYMADTIEWGNAIKTFIAKYDEKGNLLNYKTFRDSACLHYATISAPYIINKQIYVFGYMRDTTSYSNSHPPYHAFLIRVDTNLNAKLLLNYKDSTSVYFVPSNMMVINSNKTFLLAGSNQHYHGATVDQHSQPFILKMDSSGIVKSYIEYPIINRIGIYVKSVLSHDNKLFLTIAGDSTLYLGDPICHIRTINYLLELDTALNLLTVNNYSDSNAYASNSTIYYNSSYYGCGSKIVNRISAGSMDAIDLQPSLYKLSSTFKIQSNKLYQDTARNKGFLKIKLVPNESNLILAGDGITNKGNRKNFGRDGVLTKVDTFGNLLWARHYRGYTDTVNPWPYNDEYNQLIDFDFLSDGSIIALGKIFIDNATYRIRQQGWLMRLSPDGCLSSSDCGYETGMNELAPVVNEWEHSTNIFPNPSDQFIQLSCQGACSEKMQVEIYSALGQRMLHEEYSAAQTNKRLETAQLQNGIYFYKLYCNYREVGQGKFVVQR